MTAKISVLGKRKQLFLMCAFCGALFLLILRVFYLQAFEADYWQAKAYEQQTRDRLLAPARGAILDRNGVGLAVTKTAASVSVINSQITDKEEAARALAERLGLDYEYVLAKVSKRVALERIKTKVDRETAEGIRALNIPGVVVDEDTKRVYPYGSLASQTIGFVGKDNQGVTGLEAKYHDYLKGGAGKLLTETDARGVDAENGDQERAAPVPGDNLALTIDAILQQYAEQTIEKAIAAKQAARGAIIMMDPRNGEIYAMANKPDFDPNDPFTINDPALAAVWDTMSQEERNARLNRMWRNFSINDTYEPGSTFKVITSAAGLSEGAVGPESRFVCTASKLVGGRNIKCWRSPRSHGAQSFTEGVQNSCNPVFMEVAERMGAENFYKYLTAFGLNKKTGIDLAGEASGIIHSLDKVGPVELATMSFGQSFQITPIQLLRAASATINGGRLITPHFAKELKSQEGETLKVFDYGPGEAVITPETSATMREILESVVSKGTGGRSYIPGFRIGGKTATSEKLPRRSGKYIASFMAFAPAEEPRVIALVLIDEPKGAYYGGQVAGPVMKELLENALPYLGVEPVYSEAELEAPEARRTEVPDLAGLPVKEAVKILKEAEIPCQIEGDGEFVEKIFPMAGEILNFGNKIVVYTN
ncbi:MAG: PASTA domain-containing protein [Clostridiales bacterium]|jgi:stage V sporulation protein D (sporulation-specific penicillin-binding protein)|nr:PASTA domain-containing protein [Clostridiales bacterium]